MSAPGRREPDARPAVPFGVLVRNVALAAACGAVAAVMASAGETQHVALVVVDGLRYTEGLGDPSHTYVPEMWALAQQGAIVEPFRNDGFTYTSRAVPAIWCGAWTEVDQFSDPDCGGSANNHARMPTVFEYYRRQLSRPAEDCIYILGDVGCPWKASFDPDYGPAYWPLYHSVGTGDLEVWNEVEPLLDEHTPSFFLLYLSSVDHYGHSGSWSAYVSAIAVADSIVGMLWDYLQTNPFYAGTTTLIVTNDHGRHDDDFSGHGCGCDGCRTVQLLAVGPDIRAGLVSTIPRTIRDVVPTIGELLGFTAEDATGSVMVELLRYDPGALFADGFETGSTSAWSENGPVPAQDVARAMAATARTPGLRSTAAGSP